MTDPLGQSQVLPYLTGLREAGYAISLISFEKPDRYEKHRKIIEDLCSKAGIEWHPMTYRNSLPIISSLLNIRAMQRKAAAIHQKKEVHLLHCRSYLPMFAGTALKKKFGIPLLFDIRGFWPDERVDGGLWDLSHPLWKRVYAYFKRKEKSFYESADRVITLTQSAADEIHSWPLRNNPVPIDVIPCCADLDLFNYETIDPDERRALLRSLDLSEDDFIITYLGSLGTFYAIEDMLAYFRALKSETANAKFLIITASPQEIVWDAVDKMGMDRAAIRVTQAPRKDVPLHLSLGRYSLVFYRENYSRKACSPTKLGELMGLGIPVVCSPNVGDTTQIVRDAACGISLPSLTESSYESAVSDMKAFLPKDKAAIRKEAWHYFDLQDGIAKYCKVYQKLVG